METMEHTLKTIEAEVRLTLHLDDGHTIVYDFPSTSDVYNQAVQFFLADLEARI